MDFVTTGIMNEHGVRRMAEVCTIKHYVLSIVSRILRTSEFHRRPCELEVQANYGFQ